MQQLRDCLETENRLKAHQDGGAFRKLLFLFLIQLYYFVGFRNSD